MSSQTDGGPAFPRMSMRDYFAAKAMQGLLSSGHFTYPLDDDDGPWLETDKVYDEEGNYTGRREFSVIEAAFAVADRMLAKRQKGAVKE